MSDLNGFFVLSSLKMYLRAGDMDKVEEFLEAAQNYNSAEWFEYVSNYFVLLWKIKMFEEFGADPEEESEFDFAEEEEEIQEMFAYFEEDCPDQRLKSRVKTLEAQFKALLAKEKTQDLKGIKYAVLKDPHTHFRTFRRLTQKVLI